MAKDKSFSVAGGLGFQGYNTKNYAGKATARTGTDTTAATRDQFYGGASTPKKPAANPGMISFPGTATKMLKQKFTTKYTPGEYAAYRKKTVAKKPVAKPAAQVVSNVTNAKMSPTQNSTIKNKPPATRFGTVTGKTTGTRVSGGGGYGGGGTRGGGSLSGQGSGSRTAGTSRTGGTKQNNPVRG